MAAMWWLKPAFDRFVLHVVSRAVFGTPGLYQADLIPTKDGQYLFTFKGKIGTLDVNERIGRLRQDQFAYENVRVLDVVLQGHAEMWGAMKDWLKTASIPKDRLLKADLTGPMKKPNSSGTIFLEGKKEMKARGLASPDAADAIATTFAFPVASRGEYNPRKYTAPAYERGAAVTSWMGA